MKRIALVALAISMAGLLGACTAVHGSNLERIQAGMSRDQVQSIMGPPEGVAHAPGKECSYYTVLKNFWSRTPWSLSDRYYVCYGDGKVETFGRVDTPSSDQPGVG